MKKTNDELVKDLVKAWEETPQHEKTHIAIDFPELYWSIVSLNARINAENIVKARKEREWIEFKESMKAFFTRPREW